MARFSDLPEELVFKILALLPANSLLPSKCVQKSWYALIANPGFVAKQLHNQIRNKSFTDNCVLAFLCKQSHIDWDYFLGFLSASNEYEFAVRHEKIHEQVAAGFSSKLSGHSHGILCISSSFDIETIVLVNPAIRESRKLPRSCILHVGLSRRCPSKHYNHAGVGVGFGYDPKSNNYKVVRFFYRSSFHGNVYSIISAEVYTLSSDSWRELILEKEESSSRTVHSVRSPKYFGYQYVNGTCYWLASGSLNHNRQYFVLTFDMSDEVFRVISLPSCINFEEQMGTKQLLVFNETVAFVLHGSLQERSMYSFEIWVLVMDDEFGVSWNKLTSIEPNPRLRKPLAFWKNGEQIIMTDSEGGICCYDIGTKEVVEIPDQGYHRCYDEAVNYMSTLVSVRRK